MSAGKKPPAPQADGPPGGTPSSARLPLEQTKAPREWRSPRTAAETGSQGVAAPEAAPLVPVPAGLPPSPERPQASVGPPRPELPRETAGVDLGPPLPSRYGVDRLVLLVRDPHWSYSWWEVREDEVERARRDLAEPGRLVLRFYDVSAVDWDGRNHHSSFDIEVHDLAGSWYVELGRPGADFVAELGLRGADGRFLPLVRSNFVAMPRDAMSPQSDAHWIVEEEHYRRMFELSGGEAIGLGSGEILRALEERLRRELIAGGVSSFGISSLASRRQP